MPSSAHPLLPAHTPRARARVAGPVLRGSLPLPASRLLYRTTNRFVGSSPALDLVFLLDCDAEPDRIGFHVDGCSVGRKKKGGWLGRCEGHPSLRFARLRRRLEWEKAAQAVRQSGKSCSLDSDSNLAP